MTLDIVKISLAGWTPKLTRRLKELAMLMQDLLHQWMGYLKNYRQAQARSHHASRHLAHLVGHQLSTWRVLHQLRTCGSGCECHQHQYGAQKDESGEVYLREETEVIERRHLDKEALLDRRRRDLQSAIDPTVPKTLNGPDAPTESERTAHEITHLPPAPSFETCTLGRGIEAPHVRLNPLERDEKPIVDMDVAVRSRADDGAVDDDLVTFLAIVDSSTGCMRGTRSETKGATQMTLQAQWQTS